MAVGVCVVAVELLLVFIHQEANVSPTEGQQGSSGTGGHPVHANPKLHPEHRITETFKSQFIRAQGQDGVEQCCICVQVCTRVLLHTSACISVAVCKVKHTRM